MHISMVNVDQLAPLIEKTNFNGKKSVEIGSTFFQAGMIEVLKDIATSFMDEQWLLMEHSQTVHDTQQACEDKYQALLATLTDEQQALLQEFDEASSEYASALEGDQFVTGFIYGYGFIKNMSRQ